MVMFNVCVTCSSENCVSNHGWRCPQKPIEVASFEAFEKAFSKLTARAKKLGCEVPTYEVIAEYSILHWVGKGQYRRVGGGTPVKAVRVSGPRPKFDGWSLVATLQPIQSKDASGKDIKTNLIKSISGAGELPETFRTGTHCDHCQTSRYRAETFVVRHDDGRMMRVGRQCIHDFLGQTSPENVALLFAYVTHLETFGGSEDDESWGPRKPSTWPLAAYVGIVIRDIRENGWLARTAAKEKGGQATADSAFDRLAGNIEPEWPNEEEFAMAKRSIDWASSMNTKSDFDYNIQAIARSEVVTDKTLGMAAAIFGAFERSEAREVERRKAAQMTANSAHVGEVKARLDLQVTVTQIIDLESEWGSTHLHMFIDEAGNVFKWFSSSARLNIGTTYKLRGTVKDHVDYKARKETVLTRCKAEEVTA